jgi:hypothetical protein
MIYFDLCVHDLQMVTAAVWFPYRSEWVKVHNTDRQRPVVTLPAHLGDFH